MGDSYVLDGEICVLSEDGSDDFTSAVSQVKRKSVVMPVVKYLCFDVVPYDVFYKRSPAKLKFALRQTILMNFLDSLEPKDGISVTLVKQTAV